MDELVVGPLQERGIDRHDGLQAGLRHAGRHDHGMLLGDAHVVDAIREALLHFDECGPFQHRRADGDDLRVLLHHREKRLREDLRVRVARSGPR